VSADLLPNFIQFLSEGFIVFDKIKNNLASSNKGGSWMKLRDKVAR